MSAESPLTWKAFRPTSALPVLRRGRRIAGTALAVAFLTLLTPGITAKGSPRHCVFRVHAQANPHDTDTFATAVHARLSGEDVAIEKIPRISEHDVVAYYPRSAQDGTYGAVFQLDEHGRIALDALSIERRGTFLFIFINGRAVTELQIDKRVSDGRIYIPSGLTAADIDSMKKDWRLIGQKKKR